MRLETVRGEIEFRNVWFAYNGDDWVLKDVSFTIEPGKTTAFVGHTGAGKTSIISLLSRFYEFQRGEILIDGVDVRSIRKEDLRRHTAIVLQDVFLFSGDIVLCDRALRDEGTSYHYLPPARSVAAHPALVEQIVAALVARGIGHSIGSTWTTDAPYRETRRAVEACRAEGVKTVEMETAALFAVGERLNVPTAAVFVISDRLIDSAWQPVEDMRLLRHRLSTIVEALLDTLSTE